MNIQAPFSSALRVSILGISALACSGEPLQPPGGSAGVPSAPAGGGGTSSGFGGASPGGGGTAPQSGAGPGGSAGSLSAPTGGTQGQAGSAVGGMAGVGGSPIAGTGGSNQATAGTGTGGSQAGSAGSGNGGTAPGGGTGGGAAAGGSSTGSIPSKGCGTAATQALNQWVEGMVLSGGSNRPYAVRLPSNYDPMRAYPVVMLLHGCTSGTNNLPMDRQTGENAILVRGTGSAANTCWDTSASGPDVVFFDAMVAAAKERFCTDTSRFFAVGYSSGSWLINQLSCIRGGVLRAAGTVAGGNPARQASACMGRMAHMFVHDLNDMDNVISGSESARARLLMQNGCDASAQPVPQEPSPCTRYQGCEPGYPVVWCPTSGNGHNRQDNFAAPAFWNFFKEF